MITTLSVSYVAARDRATSLNPSIRVGSVAFEERRYRTSLEGVGDQMMSRRLIALIVLLAFFAPDLRWAYGQQREAKPAPTTSPADGAVKPSAGAALTKTESARARRLPAWADDARWHQVVVSRFRNGDASNDPSGCLPWSAKGDTPKKSDNSGATGTPVGQAVSAYGGDLQGLQSKLPYLKKLGVNTLYLTSIFQPVAGPRTGARRDSRTSRTVDMRHIDDSLGVAKSISRLTGETGDPKTWKFSASDRIFLGFIQEAHKQGFRVVLEGKFAELATVADSPKDLESHAFAVTTRWMDPDGNGDASDGIDGWVVSARGDFWKRTGRNWRIHVGRTNPNAVVVGDLRGSPLGPAAAGDFDLVIGYGLGDTVRRFFAATTGTYPLRQFFDELGRFRERYGLGASDRSCAIILPLGGPEMGRSLATIASGRGAPTDADLARWRLATVFQHLYAGTPMTFYGDEVGMRDGGMASAPTPMWWNDLPNRTSRSPEYRGDFLALVRMLNALREQFATLRHGDYRPVLLDEEKRIFAFGRSKPGEQAIVVMNLGDINQQVIVSAHHPGQLVRVVEPQLKPVPSRRRGQPNPGKTDPTKIPRLRVGGSRQFANELGEMSLWVAPMSVRIAFLSDED